MNEEKKPKSKSFSKMLILFVIAKMSKLVKLTKLFKMAKPITMLLSMSISAVAYAFFMGPWFSIGFVAMLFIHEMGHIVALRAKGYEARAPMFIPFLGAVIFAPPMNKRDDEAVIGIAGPLVGGIAAVLMYVWWLFVDDKQSQLAVILLMISHVGLYLNVFNMLPVSPLDGGRITQAVGPWFKYIGFAVLCVATAFIKEPVILFLWLVVIPELTMFPQNVRLVVALCTWISMTTLMLIGYGDQPWFINVMDILLGVILVLNNIIPDEINPRLNAAQRPQLPLIQRFIWLVYYLLLLGLMVMVMVWQVKFLPTPPAH